MELRNFIDFNPSEGIGHEYKTGLAWTKENQEFKLKIIRAILSMSNIKNGGLIIVGVEEMNGSHIATGFNGKDASTYNKEDILEMANSFADPPRLQLNLKIFELPRNDHLSQIKSIVVIEVVEFDDIPIICKKEGKNSKNIAILEKGRIYTRTLNKPESTPSFSSADMRDIIELAVKKSIMRYREFASYLDISQKIDQEIDSNRRYEIEREDF